MTLEPLGGAARKTGVRIRVLFFANLRERVGSSALEVELAEPATIGSLREVLASRHPALRSLMDTALFARNREFAFATDSLHEGDEVGVFPPVSGGSGDQPTLVQVTEETLDLDDLVRQITLPTTGAACIFTGMVRARSEGGSPPTTDYLEYEAYRPMAEAKLRQLASEIRSRWPGVEGVALVQRIGRLEAGTPTVVVACSGSHRDSGVFEAARYGIDRLKEIVPIWKKEIGPAGGAWVEGHYRPARQDRDGPTGPADRTRLVG
ncbi:MAG: molybdopterin converting factor subunit 1 [Anaerolineales bacterium]|jgi:molybdopterin synthase catalytic subunit